MSGKPDKTVELMDQQMALHSYLEEMLREVPDYEEPVQAPVVESPRVAPVTELKATAPAPVIEEPPEVVEHEVVAKPEAQIPEPVVSEAVHPQTSSESGVPAWAQSSFQCLLFNVAGITLAVPLEKLNGVIPWNENITPMPGHTPAFLGLLRHQGQNVKVMDTAQIILPEKQKHALDQEASERIHKIILMDEGRWGLACDDVGEVVSLEPGDVRWRTAQGKRPWLAGTVSERLCALLDTDVFATMLEEGFAAHDHL